MDGTFGGLMGNVVVLSSALIATFGDINAAVERLLASSQMSQS